MEQRITSEQENSSTVQEQTANMQKDLNAAREKEKFINQESSAEQEQVQQLQSQVTASKTHLHTVITSLKVQHDMTADQCLELLPVLVGMGQEGQEHLAQVCEVLYNDGKGFLFLCGFIRWRGVVEAGVRDGRRFILMKMLHRDPVSVIRWLRTWYFLARASPSQLP